MALSQGATGCPRFGGRLGGLAARTQGAGVDGLQAFGSFRQRAATQGWPPSGQCRLPETFARVYTAVDTLETTAGAGIGDHIFTLVQPAVPYRASMAQNKPIMQTCYPVGLRDADAPDNAEVRNRCPKDGRLADVKGNSHSAATEEVLQRSIFHPAAWSWLDIAAEQFTWDDELRALSAACSRSAQIFLQGVGGC